jgi:putative heme-binding domain-containing protein
MVDGLAGRRNLPPPAGWQSLKYELQRSDDDAIRELTDRLAQIFGDPEAISRAMKTLSDNQASTGSRRAALRALLSQQHAAVVDQLPSLLDEPRLRLDAIRAYGAIKSAAAPELLLRRYPAWDGPSKRAVIETLSTRSNYALELVGALKSGTVKRDEIPAYIARSLREIVPDEFAAVYGEVPELKKNTRQLIAKYKKMITPKAVADADPRRGRVVFQKTCAACHLLYGVGGKIGPDLTGSNRANLDYLLLNSLAPSDDVPEGYRMVIIQTDDGRILNGVIAAEDAQRIVLKTVDQPELVIAKEDIEARKVSETSMMPDGQLQQLTKQQVLDLIKYMQTTEQVELPE